MPGWESEWAGVGGFLELEIKDYSQLFKFLQLNWKVQKSHFISFQDIDPMFKFFKNLYDEAQVFSARAFSHTAQQLII